MSLILKIDNKNHFNETLRSVMYLHLGTAIHLHRYFMYVSSRTEKAYDTTPQFGVTVNAWSNSFVTEMRSL